MNSKYTLNRSGMLSVETYLDREGLDWKKSGAAALLRCPFHDDTRPSLLLNLADGHYRCLACGERGGDLIAFHRQRTGLGFAEAVRELGGRCEKKASQW